MNEPSETGFENVQQLEEYLRSGDAVPRGLHKAFDQRQPIVATKNQVAVSERQIPWIQQDVMLPVWFAEQANKTEEFLLACDVAREALEFYGNRSDEETKIQTVKLRKSWSAALASLGFTRQARAVLEPCVQENFRPTLGSKLRAELLFQLGNILRDESAQATERAVMLQTAEQALNFYDRALAIDPRNPQIMALTAAASLVLGEPNAHMRDRAFDLARQLLQLVQTLDDHEGPQLKTARARATAYAVLGRFDEAMQAYADLKDRRGAKTPELADARFYSRFLAKAHGKPEDFYKNAFPPLQLIVFAGHVTDLPNNPPRFPVSMVDRVRQDIRAKLEELDARVALVSAAAGADLLFIDEMLKRNGTVHLVLPWSRGEFKKTSIDPFESPLLSPSWSELFDKAMKAALTIREIGQVYKASSDVGWRYMTEVNAGLAINIARTSRLDLQPVVLWDGQPGLTAGSTASFAGFWVNELKQKLIRLDLPDAATACVLPPGYNQESRCESPTLHQEVKSMLFADIVGYSKISEHVIPEFIELFMGRLSQLVATSKHPPRSVDTWGDALYAVFDYAYDAGCFALELLRMIQEGAKDWEAKGLGWDEVTDEGKKFNPLNIRIGLHTGPVFMHYNPVVRRHGYTGAHVSRAARIEPIALHGGIYASEEFASLSELDSEIKRRTRGDASDARAGFVCEYAGTMKLAKNYPGRFRIYHILPKRVLAIEELARAAHDMFCSQARKRNETAANTPALRPWEELGDDLQDANRAQVADIPNKLRLLGYELAPNSGIRPSEIEMAPQQIEQLASLEHDRWMEDRKQHGWTFGPQRDNVRKLHPLLIPWDQLNELEKDKDRDTVKNLPVLIERAGFRVRKIAP